ncbi:MAG: pilin [Candidatus Altiarchaeota archaeon]
MKILNKFMALLGIFFILNFSTGYDCKLEGCPPDYRCMANGECTPLKVKEYCEDHGKPPYIYNDALLLRNCSDILNENEQKLCMQCKGDYELRKNVSDIENIVYGITAGIAILFLVVNAIRLITSYDPESRENSKKAIIYVIIAVIIIAIATKFIEYLLM